MFLAKRVAPVEGHSRYKEEEGAHVAEASPNHESSRRPTNLHSEPYSLWAWGRGGGLLEFILKIMRGH